MKDCIIYFIFISVWVFLIGLILPRSWFRYEDFPYCTFSFENQGRIYEKTGIRFWQNKVPNMSKIFPKLLPPKNLQGQYRQRLPRMLQETCVAEFVHCVLCVLGLYGMQLWPGMGGILATAAYILLGNLPFILIQRYNRPRLAKLYQRVKQRSEEPVYERIDFKL